MSAMERMPAREWTDPELGAAGALAASVMTWAFLAMRLTDGGLPVAVPPRHLLFTYVAAIVLMVVALSVVAALVAARRSRQGRAEEVERDERDLAIELRAERVEGWVGLGGLNVLVVHALAASAYGYGRDLLPMPTTVSGYVFALLTLAFCAYAAKQVATLWLYRR